MIYEDSAEEAIAAAKIILSENQYDAEIEVLEGDTANAVLQHAENIGADLVITGTRDQNRLKKAPASAASATRYRQNRRSPVPYCEITI